MSVPVKLLGHFAQNRHLRAPAEPPVDRRRLVTDPQLRQEVAIEIGRHLRANPPGYSGVDDVEAAFTAAIMRTAELVIPPQERRRPGCWRGDARTEAELQAATDAIHTAWQRLQLEETKKVKSQCVRDEEGRLLRDKGRIRERWVRFFRSLLNSKYDMLNPDIPKKLPRHPVASALGIEPTEEEIATAMKTMENAKAVGPDGLPAELLKLGLQQDRTILVELHRITILI